MTQEEKGNTVTTPQPSGIKRRGFASMSAERRREIASAGGRAAHRAGTAHKFTAADAADAGRKGGLARRNRGVGE